MKDLTSLLKLVTEQEKKYGYRLSPLGNFYQRHVMVQRFLQIQISTKGERRDKLSLNVARSFGRNKTTARSLIQWENMWIDTREISERKERTERDFWMHDPDLIDAMRTWVRGQGDSKFCVIKNWKASK